MGLVLTLLKYDLASLRYWLSKQKFSKAFVIFCFILILIAGAIFFYHFSRIFFYPLAGYKKFGFLTADYLIRAAVVVLSWFALVSAVVSMSSLLQSSNRQINYLLTLPVKINSITGWIFIKSSLLNFFLLWIMFFPIIASYADVFLGGISLILFTRFLFVLLVLVVMINSLAGIVSYLAVFLIKGKTVAAGIFTLVVLFLVTMILIKVVLPEQLDILNQTADVDFFQTYSHLPLNNQFLPVFWLVETLFLGFGPMTGYLLVVAVFLLSLSLFFQNNFFLPLFQRLASQPYEIKRNIRGQVDNKIFKNPLIYKDYLSISRLSSEMGYIYFLSSLVFFFYLLLGIILRFRASEDFWSREIVVFSSVWLSFFTTCFFLRIVYPLMAREGPNAWYLFTLPVERPKILKAKISLAILSCPPLFIIALLLWLVVPIGAINRVVVVIISCLMTLALSLVNSLLGAVNPNFEEGEDPEKLSTSAMGLITLFTSAVLVIYGNYFLYLTISGNISIGRTLVNIILTDVVFVLVLFWLAKRSVKSYQF